VAQEDIKDFSFGVLLAHQRTIIQKRRKQPITFPGSNK
jgi:hypothetical protein